MYFDESGDTAYDQLVVLAGYLIRSDRAEAMERKWRAVLGEYGLSVFHMVDCAHGAGEFGRLTLEQRVSVQTKCIDLVVEHVELGVAWAMNPHKFQANAGQNFSPDDKDDVAFLDPYSHGLVQAIVQLAGSLRRSDGLDLFVEAGHTSEPLARHAISQFLNIGNLLASGMSTYFVTKDHAGILQAADILAWQVAKMIKDLVKSLKVKRRADYTALLRAEHRVYAQTIYRNEQTVSLIGEAREVVDIPPQLAKYLQALFTTGEAGDRLMAAVHERFDKTGELY